MSILIAPAVIETKMDVKTAEPSPDRLKPGTKYAIEYRIRPLITNINNPRLIIFIGKVSRIKIGRKIELKIPNSNAATINASGPSTSAQGETLTTTIRATLVTNSFTKNL